MRATGRDETRPDAAAGLATPDLHRFCPLAAGIADKDDKDDKDMDPPPGREPPFDRARHGDRALGIGALDRRHLRLRAFQTGGTLKIQMPASGRPRHRRSHVQRRQDIPTRLHQRWPFISRPETNLAHDIIRIRRGEPTQAISAGSPNESAYWFFFQKRTAFFGNPSVAPLWRGAAQDSVEIQQQSYLNICSRFFSGR